MDPINYLSKNIVSSVKASREYHGAQVILAKRGLLSVVLEAVYPNRHAWKYRLGYCRFGRPAIWLDGHNVVPSATLRLTAADGTPLAQAIVEEGVKQALKAADEVTAIARAAS